MVKKIIFLTVTCLSAFRTQLLASKKSQSKEVIESKVMVSDYVLENNGTNIDNSASAFKELEDNFKNYVQIANHTAKETPMLMWVVMNNRPKNEEHIEMKKKKKSMVARNRQLASKTYIVKCHTSVLSKNTDDIERRLGFYVLQTLPAHIVPALCQFLQVNKDKQPVYVLLNEPICPACYYLLHEVIGYKEPVSYKKNGCQGRTFSWPMPPLVLAYVNNFIKVSDNPLQAAETTLQTLKNLSVKSLEEKDSVITKLKEEVEAREAMIQNQYKQFISLQHKMIKGRALEKNKKVAVIQPPIEIKDINFVAELKKELQREKDEHNKTRVAKISLEEQLEEHEEKERVYVLPMLEEAISTAKTLRPNLVISKLWYEGAKKYYGAYDVALVQKSLDIVITQWVQAKNLPSRDRNTLLQHTNEEMYKIWWSLKQDWDSDVLKVLSIKRTVLAALLKSAVHADPKHIKIFQQNLIKHNLKHEAAELYIENSLYSLCIARTQLSSGELKSTLIKLEQQLAEIPTFGESSLAEKLVEAKNALQKYLQSLSNDNAVKSREKQRSVSVVKQLNYLTQASARRYSAVLPGTKNEHKVYAKEKANIRLWMSLDPFSNIISFINSCFIRWNVGN